MSLADLVEDDTVPAEYFWNEVRESDRLQQENARLEEENQRLREELERLREQFGTTAAPIDDEPFPLDTLPSLPRAHAQASAEALDVAPAMVAVPLLSVLAAGVEASMRLQLKRTWTEPATLWTAVVAPSGSTKSAGLRRALRPVYKHETEALDAYEQAMDRYDPDGDAPRPVRTRYRSGDPTTEAVVRILDDNPRGVLLARDELAAWIGSFDRYSSGAADLQFWIEVWNGVQVSRDRVGDGNVTVPHPAVPLTGTIQPDTLREKLGEIHFQTGFASRLLLCRPPTSPKSWTEADVTAALEERYGQLLRTLYALEDRMQHGEPATVGLTPEAKDRWVSFFDDENERLSREPDGPARAARAKGITHAARLALIFHLCRVADGQREPGPVGRGTLSDGVRLAGWALRETLRVYRTHELGAEQLDPPERFLKRLPTPFTTADAKEAAAALDITERTMYRWLDALQENGKIEKTARGHYRKRA